MLELEALTVRFGGLTAVDAVTFAAGRQEVVGLVGPNGAGKTTLFNAVSGLVRPSGGSMAFDSRSEEHTSELQSLKRISYAVFCLKKKKQNEIQQSHDT